MCNQTYCTLCDMYFWDAQARQEHIQSSDKHPLCEKCNKRFAHRHALRIHLTFSTRHHYCNCCELDFRTAAGFRAHVEFAAVHRDDSDDSDDGSDSEEPAEGWEEEVGQLVFPHVHTDMDGVDSYDSDEEEESADGWFEEEFLDRAEDYQEEGEEGNIRPIDFRLAANEHVDADDDVEEEEQEEEDEVSPSDGVDCSPAADSQSIVKAPAASKPRKAQAASNGGKTYTCPMCLEGPTRASVTLCGHVFCTNCIKQALTMKSVCPVCRDGVNPYQLRKIYLA